MKTNNKIVLNGGYLTFLKDRMEIQDNSKLEKILILLGFFASSLYGLYFMLAYTGSENPMMYYSGVLILIIWALATPFLIQRTYKQVLFYKEIGEIDMQHIDNGDFKAILKLKKGKVRCIYLKRNSKNLKELVNKLNENHLKTDVQPLTA